MKRLLIAIAAAATTMFASARVIQEEGFETSAWEGVTATAYGEATPVSLQYPFSGTNTKYGVLDDVATSPEAEGATCFDMYVQFKPLTEAPAELDDGAKLAVYADADYTIHVFNGTDDYTTDGTVDADTWARLTIVAESNGYKVYVNGGSPILGTLEGSEDSVSVFPAATGATTVEFTGSGKLDNFVARTTNPFYSGACAASVGTGDDNEKYATYSDALADVLSSGATDAITIAGETPRIVNGTSANPYEITNLADLEALQAAIAATNGVDKCYTLTADIALDAPWDGIGLKNGKDVYSTAEFNAAAFCGTFDGQNHTISGFQMVGGGLDYCGFFNSTYNATIKNLKIQYAGALFAADTTASTKESGATFVGVAKNSTLQNLTSLQKDSETPVSCSKGFGGIVGYTTSGTTVDSCTNNVNMTSLANNKCGGIAMITQKGDAVTIRNCQNNGTQTTGSSNSEYGAIVGYVGLNTTIANCETTVGRFLKHEDKTVTLQGVNKGDARVASYHGAATPGLNFATVDGDVATFVADNALAAGNTYKVMGPTATATYAFTDTGSISFDTSLATPTYAITVANPNMFDVTSATEEDVTTYTAVGGTAVASLTKDEVATEYNTIAKALDAAEDGDTLELLANCSDDIALPTGVAFNVGGYEYTGTVTAASGDGYEVVENEGVYTIVDNTASTWVGDDDDFWATASNWSTGLVPGQYTTVTFPNAGRVRFAEGNGSVNVGAMVVNANVTFSENNINYANYPFINVCGGSISGTGSMTLERCGLKGNGTTLTVGCPVVFAGDSATTHDCFLQNGPIVFNGTVSSTLGRLHLQTPVTFNGAVNLENATMTSIVGSGSAPTFNGAVTLGTGASILTYAVTYNDALTIGDGAVVSVGSNTQTYGNNFVLAGSGRFIGDTVDVKDKVKAAFRDPTAWTGTYEIKGRTIASVWWLTDVGNANSKVCFNNVTTYLYNTSYSGSHAIGGMEIGAGGLTINGTYNKAGTWALPELSGTGTLTIGAVGNENKFITFSADCSDFAGNIAWTDAENINVQVVFGSTDREFTAKTIVVGAGAEVGAETWTAVNGIFVDGTVSLASASSALTVPEGGVVGSGKIVASAVPTTAPALDADNWTGTFVADWEGEVLSANKGKRIDFNSYGTANSIVEVTKLARGYDGTGSDYTVVPTVKVSGTMTLDNGYSGKITTLTKLTGSGAVTFKNYTVNITTLDNFSGTLTPTDATGTTIGTINLESTPAVGTKIVSLGENAKVNIESTKVSVSGVVDDTIKLELKSDGIYVAEPPAPKVAEVVGGEQYETLAEALAAATDGATVKLLANIAVTEMQLVTKAVTLDLAGFAITAGERSAEAATAGDDSILCVLHGGSLTINDSSAGGTGAITGNSVFTSAVKMTKKGDTDDTKKAVLVVNGGTLTGYYYGISGNGLAGRGNTEVTINGGSVYGTCVNDSVAIFQPQLGTLTINGGYLEGAMGVYVKSGTATVAINGGTIKGNGTYAAYVHSTNGFNNTGDAFVVDNAGYPGGAPAPSILGGTFVSVNASAIASYAKTGLERIVHFADKSAVTITETVASAEDVFLAQGFPGGEDGKTFTIDTAVQAALAEKIPEGKALTDAVAGTTSGVTYAQAYALGLLDEATGDVEKDVTPTIEVKNGKVVVSLDATAKAGYKVMLNVYQKTSLTENWPVEPTTRYELGSADEEAGFEPSKAGAGFYKVGVTIEDAE